MSDAAAEVGQGQHRILGLAPVGRPWFDRIARWSNEATIAAHLTKTISAEEVRQRLQSGQTYAALIIDAHTIGLDRDLIDQAQLNGCVVLVVDRDPLGPDWEALGASVVLDPDFSSSDLSKALASIMSSVSDPMAEPNPHNVGPSQPAQDAMVISVTGIGGSGASTIAMALAQGLAELPGHRSLLLADMALRTSQAMQHDVGDVVPGILELVEAHRFGHPEPDELRSLIFDVRALGYHLLLGLRSPRDWLNIPSGALDASWSSLTQRYRTIVCDIDADFDGIDSTGSADIEDRNRLSRLAIGASDLCLVVGHGSLWGVTGIVRTVNDLVDAGVRGEQIMPCINHAPKSPRARAELVRTLADLFSSQRGHSEFPANPIFVTERRGLDRVVRDAGAIPVPMAETLAQSIDLFVSRAEGGHRSAQPLAAMTEDEQRVVPGSLGVWRDAS